MTPAIPAAHWVWPMFDLTEPTSRGRAGSGPCRKSVAMQRLRPDRRYVCRCRAPRPRRCPPQSGRPCQSATNDFLLCRAAGRGEHIGSPSCPTAVPRITATTGSNLRTRKCGQHQNPSSFGDAEPVRRCGERLGSAVLGKGALKAEADEDAGGADHGGSTGDRQVEFTERNDWAARCTATRDDEQPVSTEIAGPWSPSA